jgi:LEA14-like dessication related protein
MATDSTLDVMLELYNPNLEIAVALYGIDYSLYIDDTYLGDGRIIGMIDIPPGGVRIISSPFKLSTTEAAEIVLKYLTKLAIGSYRKIYTGRLHAEVCKRSPRR